ncbi:unnamed protein product [Paramecium primaurelia]|uniref:Uncharacterized protein n=1 Tax=Paramecium primaurelia TaxID=5886 RepID=A0A8S1KTU8_PARPR|nr:unnamed protein product [Paramecium primaurelia]
MKFRIQPKIYIQVTNYQKCVTLIHLMELTVIIQYGDQIYSQKQLQQQSLKLQLKVQEKMLLLLHLQSTKKNEIDFQWLHWIIYKQPLLLHLLMHIQNHLSIIKSMVLINWELLDLVSSLQKQMAYQNIEMLLILQNNYVQDQLPLQLPFEQKLDQVMFNTMQIILKIPLQCTLI